MQREILEELNLEVAIAWNLPLVSHQYPEFLITLYPFVCLAKSDVLQLQEHAQALWLKPEALKSLDWAEADLPVLDAYLGQIKSRGP